MGANLTIVDVPQSFEALGLKEPAQNIYECEFERQIYKAISVFRAKPISFKDTLTTLLEKYPKDKKIVQQLI